MKILLLLLVMITADPTEISRNNRLKSQGEKAFIAKDFAKAASAYSELYDTLSIRDPKIGLNLAHSHFALGDTANAKLYYQGVAAEGDKNTKSIAYQQLGVIAKKPETLKESLQYLKSALKANPYNEEARYNYELVKKQLNQQQQQQDQNQENQDQENEENQDQEQQDQENQENQDQENQDGEQSEEEQENQEQESEEDGEQSDEEKEQESQEGEEQDESDEQNQQQSTQEKLEEMNITEDKARMILEAMKNNEIQYIQQQKRKATKPQDTGKPDW